MATVEVTNDTFENTVTNEDIVLVDFWAEWCGPCKRFGPVFDKASQEHGDVVFAKVDTEANGELAQALAIEGIPTLMAFREGVLLFRQAGALSGGQLESLIGQVKDVDMETVHAEVKRLTEEQAAKES